MKATRTIKTLVRQTQGLENQEKLKKKQQEYLDVFFSKNWKILEPIHYRNN